MVVISTFRLPSLLPTNLEGYTFDSKLTLALLPQEINLLALWHPLDAAQRTSAQAVSATEREDGLGYSGSKANVSQLS